MPTTTTTPKRKTAQTHQTELTLSQRGRDGVANETKSAHHTLLSLRISGGFLAGAELEFADGINCLIGGRGAGKTTALEFLRYGLGLSPDAKTNPQRLRSLENLVKANLGDGEIAIDLRTKTDMQYTASRTLGEDVHVTNEAGKAVAVSLDRDLIFGADIFSQNEIEEMASSPAAQLALLDRFEEEEGAAITRELEQCRRQLEQSSADLKDLDQEIDDARATASELIAIQEKLKGFTEASGPNAKKLNEAHSAKALRGREAKLPELVIAAMQKTMKDFANATTSFQTLMEAHLESALTDGANREVFKRLQDDVASFDKVLVKANTTVTSAARDAEAHLRGQASALAERHATQEAEYRSLVAKFEEEGGRAAERTALQTALATASTAAKEQQAKEKQRQGVVSLRRDLLKRASELRNRRFALREKTAKKLSSKFPIIRVSVTRAAGVDAYQDLLATALKGANLKHVVVADRIAHAFTPSELVALVQREEEDDEDDDETEEVEDEEKAEDEDEDQEEQSEASPESETPATQKSANKKAAAAKAKAKAKAKPPKPAGALAKAELNAEQSKRALDALRASGLAYAIEVVDLDDRPRIELLDGDNYKESSNLSTGQRCTTILPILLVQSERPLIIDQPEDNLDNAFVYDTIVKALQTIKGSRQIIFVTHNPNIPVLGEAERIFVFESDGQHASIKQAGSVDECKEQIERILEGGRDAFLQRKKRYGH